MTKLYQQIFSITNENEHKNFRFMGLKFKFRNNKNKQNLNSINNTTADISNKMDRIISLLNEQISIITKNFDILLQSIQDNRFYNDSFEENWIKKFLKELELIDIVNAYSNLIHGLDDNSIKVVSRILKRIKRVNNGEKINLLYKDEIETIKDLYENYYPNIVELSSNCYAYKNYLLPINSFEVPIFYNNLWLDTLKTLDKNSNKDIIDAGAFIGDSALKLSEYTNGNVHAFEPLSINYNLMCQTIKINNNNKIIPVNMGLGLTDEVQTAYISGSATTCKFKNESLDKEPVQITSIDKYVSDNKLNIGLIKTDVEGFEQNLIKGAIETIKSQKPILIISIYHTADNFFNIKTIIENLNIGYKFKIQKATYGQMLLETVLIAEVY